YHLLQDYPKAFEEAKNGIKMTAGDARSIYYLYAGKIAADLSRSQGLEKYGYNAADLAKDAEKYLTKLLKFEQFKVQAQATLAILFSQNGNWAKAFDSSYAVVQRVPNDPTMQNILGLSAFNLGRTDTAVNALTEAIKLNPGNPVYHRDIGLVYKRLNRYNEAKEHFEKAAASTNSSEALRAEVLRELESLKNSQYQLQEFNKYGQ
ncbi:MAG: tetratricopeptide repeat protein, partial [Candidatus Riflebacteria bacterium]|nr:tetratricopeptide repeat protein [Candidatus Riflebacteria bacterium]